MTTPGVEQTDHVYIDVELPSAVTDGHPLHPPAEPPAPSARPGPIDYAVTVQPDGRFTASLNCRAVACDGASTSGRTSPDLACQKLIRVAGERRLRSG